MQANLWHHKLFHFPLPFWIWKVWKGREKITKMWISREQKELFHSFSKTFFIIFEGLSFYEKIADTSFKSCVFYFLYFINRKHLKNFEKCFYLLFLQLPHPKGKTKKNKFLYACLATQRDWYFCFSKLSP